MSQPDNASLTDYGQGQGRGPGRPLLYDPLELAAIYTDGINRGNSVAAIALEMAELRAALVGTKHTRQIVVEVRKRVSRLERAMRRARETLLQPWKPTIGKGILRYDGTGHVTGFGEVTFMGRSLPKPIGIEPRTPARRGRPRKKARA